MGLATAVAAHRRGCRRIAVVDQAREFKPVGDYININPNGVRALHIFAPELAVKLREQVRTGSGSFRFTDVDGNVLKSNLPTRNANGEPNVGTTWHFIQTLLRSALPDDVDVHLNSQLVQLTDEEDGNVRADFIVNRIRPNPFAHWNADPAAEAARNDYDANGSVGEPEKCTMRARLVVGADGINSCARAEVYRRIYGAQGVEYARAKYSGFVSFKATGSAPLALQETVDEVDNLYFPEGGTMTLVGCRRERARTPGAPNVMLVHLRGEMVQRAKFEWKFIVHAAVPEHVTGREQRAKGYADLLNVVEDELRKAEFPECVQKMAHGMLRDEGDGDRQIVCRPLYIVPISTPPPYELAPTATRAPVDVPLCFGHGRIILIGDALHGMPPFISQGTSMGFEDVVELVDLLAEECGWTDGHHNVPDNPVLDELRAKYADARIERIARAQTETLSRRWAFDENEFAIQQKWITEFIPRARGWKSDDPE